MDLLKNPAIEKQLSERNFFDLKKNNNRLDIIVFLHNDPMDQLRNKFHQIISDEKTNENYYCLNSLFSQTQMIEPNAVINLIIETIAEKIKIIQEVISDEENDIDLASYIQLWKSYKDFSQRLYSLIKNYQYFLVERNIKTNKISHDILSILQICMFYMNIINDKSIHGDSIIKSISDDLSEVNRQNIEQLIDYIDSIRAFMMMKDFTLIDREKLFSIIKNIMNKTTIVNTMCAYMHNLLKSLTNKQAVVDETEYETVVAVDAEKKTVKKIYKIATILSTYAEKSKLLICYNKFMQTRIVNLKYDNLELEIEIIKRISGALGKEESQKLIDTIADIIHSKQISQSIHNAKIQVTSDEYRNLIGISSKIVTPIIITKNNWKIYNTSDMEPIYPSELKCYIDIINKCYASIDDNKHIINWQPTLGSAQFEAQLGSKKVEITCNILQAIALIYLNNSEGTTITCFANDTMINSELATKIFESLFEANILTYLPKARETDSEFVYIVNTKNYTGDLKMDIRRTFIEAFEIETNKQSNEKSTSEHNSDEKIPSDKTPMKKLSYQQFVTAELKNQRKLHPGLKNTEYMKQAAKAWSSYKKNMEQMVQKKEMKPAKKYSKYSDKEWESLSDLSECSEEGMIPTKTAVKKATVTKKAAVAKKTAVVNKGAFGKKVAKKAIEEDEELETDYISEEEW